ncbi:MAG: hypothetical protein EXQ81_07450 [Thermoleophilia bacterium]|nr:hypothetical protein [Thermoleophilia bacterium]
MKFFLFLFDRGENLAGGIYGTILVTSIVAASDTSLTIWRSLSIVTVTIGVFWLAHVYAGLLAWSIESDEPISYRQVRQFAFREWPLLQAVVVPALALVAGGIGLIEYRTAYAIAIGYGAASLIWWGLLYARNEHLGRRATLVVVLVNALFGLGIVVLKWFVGH